MPSSASKVRSAWIALLCASVAQAQSPQQPQASPAVPAAAATAPLGPLTAGPTAEGWRFVGLAHKPDIPPSVFEPGSVDGVAGVRIVNRSSYGTWAHAWRGPAGTLQWRWRLDEPLSGGTRPADIRRQDGDDIALKVCVLFDHPLERVPFGERTLLRLARTVSGEALPAATVCYLWDPAQASNASGANPYSRRVRYLVLQGKTAPLQRWVRESRDVAADFVRLFGDELPPASPGSDTRAVPPASAVVIGGDSDNTQARSSGWVAQLQWQ
jgi:Protein of unknown function (DUF3047)